jgi:hypothetical protein
VPPQPPAAQETPAPELAAPPPAPPPAESAPAPATSQPAVVAAPEPAKPSLELLPEVLQQPAAVRAEDLELAVAPRRSKGLPLALGAIGAAGIAAGLIFALRSPQPPAPPSTPAAETSPAPAAAAAAPAPRTPPAGPKAALKLMPLSRAPAGTVAQPGKSRTLTLSASGLALDLPRSDRPEAAAQLALGNKLLGKGDGKHSAAVFAKLAASVSGDPGPLYGAALAHWLQGRDAEALETAEMVLLLDAKHAGAHLLVAYLRQLAGEEPRAREHYLEFAAYTADAEAADGAKLVAEQLMDKP